MVLDIRMGMCHTHCTLTVWNPPPWDQENKLAEVYTLATIIFIPYGPTCSTLVNQLKYDQLYSASSSMTNYSLHLNCPQLIWPTWVEALSKPPDPPTPITG
jgi:hypothetical protein